MVTPDPFLLAKRLFDEIDVTNPTVGDLVFNIFGVGNTTAPNQPFERFQLYEELVKALREHNAQRYGKLHKGTAFYFLSWLAFDLKNYEKALFYMDAAISEDIRRAPAVWLTEPAGSFLTLSDPKRQVGGRHVEAIRVLLDREITRFNAASGRSLTTDDVVKKFTGTFLGQPEGRTIVSAWYIHFLEFEERLVELNLRSTAGGSIAPFLDHLFRGGLLLESVLKFAYQPAQAGGTLGDIYKLPAFAQDFGSGPYRASAAAIQDIANGITGNVVQDAFSTSAQLRNTTGHNLLWDDAFKSPGLFQKLYEQEVNAMLLVIDKKL